MKVKNALKRFTTDRRGSLILALASWLAFVFIHCWEVAAFAAAMTVYMVADTVMITIIRRRAKRDPEFLDESVS